MASAGGVEDTIGQVLTISNDDAQQDQGGGQQGADQGGGQQGGRTRSGPAAGSNNPRRSLRALKRG